MKKNIFILSVVVLLLLVVSVYFQLKLSGPEAVGDIGDVEITLERTACFGSCPVYKLRILGDGSVNYEGEKFVEVVGTRTIKIGESKVKELVDAFYKADYFSLKDSYVGGECATDHPYAMTSIVIGEVTKSVNNYHGCSSPDKLVDLEDKIDELVGSSGWIKGQ
tara:strand:+ start:203 stop:694 length:492 start_codon:yes stop_codon:yes gene_type:complete